MTTNSERPNSERGEAAIRIGAQECTLRPTYAALLAAEEELGPLFGLIERASQGELRLAETAALFWHCLTERDGLTRERVGEAIAAMGMAAASKPLRALLAQILKGGG